MRIAFYSPDSHGLGHLRRCLKLASAFRSRLPRARGLIVTGSPWTGLFRPPPGFAYAPVAPVFKVGPGCYEMREPAGSLERDLAVRSREVGAALERFDPQLLVVDNVPTGLGGELLPTLERLRKRAPGGPSVILVLRDIVDDEALVLDQWEKSGAYDALDRLYDEIWVFGAAHTYDPRIRYRLSPLASARVRFFGYLGSGANGAVDDIAPERSDPPTVLVTGGGGGDAAPLLEAYAAAAGLAPPHRARLVLGPDFPFSHRLPALAPGTEVHRFCPQLPRAIAAADAIVCMAGYNTVCEILEAGTPAVLVPRVWPRREQLLRARALEASGRGTCLHPDDLTPGSLAAAIEKALTGQRHARHRSLAAQAAAERAENLLVEDIYAR